MGQGQSCDNLYQAALYRYYKNHTAKYGGSSDEMSIAGGSEIAGGLVYTGGYSSLEHYGNSVFSKAKEDLIRKLARSGMSVIGIKSPETAPIDQIISKFKSVIPKPGSGKKIHPASANQEKICRSMAKAINNAYGIDLIDEEADVSIICNKVAEVLYSLFTGLHSEFLSVAGDVSRSLRNLEVLQGIVDSANKKIMEDLTRSDDSELSAAAENSKKLYDRVAEEIKRQHVILANLVNSSIGPTGESLVNILEESHEFTGLVDDLKTQLGTPYFGDQLSQLLSGISEVAHAAQLVDKSLKEIGMSVSEYKSSKNITELRQNVLDHIIKKKPSSGEMHKLLIAADMIYKNDLAHDDIADYLSKKGGNLFGGVDGGAPYNYSSEYETSFADMVSDKMSFDQINTPFDGRIESKRRSISKQIKDQQKYRRALFASLLSDFKVKYEKIMYSLNNLAKKIGTDDLEYSTTLELFIRQLALFRDSHPDKQNMHIALSGFRKDLGSIYTKYEFLNNLMEIADTCRELSKGKSSELYKGIVYSIDELIEMVDKFNDNFVKTMTKVHVTMERPKRGGDIEDDLENDDVLGGNESGNESDNEVKELSEQDINNMSGGMNDSDFRYIVTMAKIIREIEYKYKIHHIKKNLSMSAELNKEVSVNYENILGEEAGFMIDKINEKYKYLLECADKTTFPTGIDAQFLYAHNADLAGLTVSTYNMPLRANINNVKNNLNNEKNKEELESIVSGYKFLLEYIRSAKVELIEASQALDLYLSQFIQDIEKNPDTIKDFLQILEQIEIVAKWFTDKSGNDLAYVFEAFTCYQGGADLSGRIGNTLDFGYPNVNISSANDTLTLFKSGNNFNRRTELTNANPIYLNGKHYYEDLKNHENINANLRYLPGRFYLPYLMTFNEAKNFVKLIEKSFKNVRALENIIATFSKVNANSDKNIKTFMPVGMLFKAFMKYAVASSISVGFNLLNEANEKNIPGNQLLFTQMNNIQGHNNALFSKMAVGLRFYKDSLKWNCPLNKPNVLHNSNLQPDVPDIDYIDYIDYQRHLNNTLNDSKEELDNKDLDVPDIKSVFNDIDKLNQKKSEDDQEKREKSESSKAYVGDFLLKSALKSALKSKSSKKVQFGEYKEVKNFSEKDDSFVNREYVKMNDKDKDNDLIDSSYSILKKQRDRFEKLEQNHQKNIYKYNDEEVEPELEPKVEPEPKLEPTVEPEKKSIFGKFYDWGTSFTKTKEKPKPKPKENILIKEEASKIEEIVTSVKSVEVNKKEELDILPAVNIAENLVTDLNLDSNNIDYTIFMRKLEELKKIMDLQVNENSQNLKLKLDRSKVGPLIVNLKVNKKLTTDEQTQFNSLYDEYVFLPYKADFEKYEKQIERIYILLEKNKYHTRYNSDINITHRIRNALKVYNQIPSIQDVQDLDQLELFYTRIENNKFQSIDVSSKVKLNLINTTIDMMSHCQTDDNKYYDDLETLNKYKNNINNNINLTFAESKNIENLYTKFYILKRNIKNATGGNNFNFYNRLNNYSEIEIEKSFNTIITILRKNKADPYNIEKINNFKNILLNIKRSVKTGGNVNNGTFLRLCDPLTTDDNLTESTDRLFEWCLKSMVSKIFIVVGSYNLFHKPSKLDYNSVVLSNHPLRQVLGGSNSGFLNNNLPKIHKDAVELYIRLPLLVEWYKKVFEFQHGNNQPSSKVHQNSKMIITIMPDMDSFYGDLLRAMMIDAKSVEDGGYPAEYAEKIIRTISDIWVNFKTKKSNCTTSDVIMNFIQEINRRYGFMMRQEIGAYWDEHESLYGLNDNQEYPDEDRVDYDLLNSEEQYSRRSAPSDKYRKVSVVKNLKDKNRKSMDEFAVAIREFRAVVDSNLILTSLDPANLNPSSLGADALGQMSLTTMINQIKNRVDQAKTDKEQYQIIYEQLHGIDRFADVDQYRMLLFHETVISPLTIIYYVYLMLNDYNRFMISLNMEDLEDIVTKYLNGKLNFSSSKHGLNCVVNPNPIDKNNNHTEAAVPLYFSIALLEKNNAKFKGSNKFKLNDDNFNEYKDAILIQNKVHQYFNNDMINYIPYGYMTQNKVYNISEILAGGNFGAGVNNHQERVSVVKRFCVNKQKLMEDVLRKLMKMGTDLNSLTEVYFSGDSNMRYPSVNFNKLEEVCFVLFTEAKNNLASMKKHIPREIIKKYEDLKINIAGVNVDNQMSLFYLQENLFERLFKNKFGNGLQDSNNALKHIWNYLTEENPFNYINNYRAMCIQRKDGYTVDISHFKNVATDLPTNPRKEISKLTIQNINGYLPINQNDYNTNTEKVNLLLNEYKFDSYNDVMSKLAFWDVTMNHNNVFDSLGLRTIVKQQQDIMSFPAKYIPIFKSGNALSQQSNIKEERSLAYSINVSDELENKSGKIDLFDNSIAVVAYRKPENNNRKHFHNYELILGAHNLYDWNDNLSSSIDIKLDSFNRLTAGNPKGKDKANVNNANERLGAQLGLIPKINNLLYKYCSMFIDQSNKKIYKPLLEAFVQGYNAKDILQGKNINDRVICDNDFGKVPLFNNTYLDLQTNPNKRSSAVCQLEPPEQAVLFASLASAVKGLMTISMERVTGNFPIYSEDNFANISEYQKELMRAYLPIFEKELSILINRANFLRMIMESTRCKVYKWKKHRLINGQITKSIFTANGTLDPETLIYNTNSNPSYTQPMKIPEVETESNRKSYLIGICDNVSTSAKSLLKCVNEVQKELADVPLYFETYKNSIVDYNNRNNQLPFMPLSSITHLLNISSHRYNRSTNKRVDENNNIEENVMYKLDLIPSVGLGVGSTEFKFAYGTRGILGKQPIKLDYMPGMSHILEWNTSGIIGGSSEYGSNNTNFNKKRMSDLVEGSVLLNRWLTDLIYHHTVLDANDYHNIRIITYDTQLRRNNVFNRPTVGLTCQTGKINARETEFWSKDENIILSMESDNFKQVLYRLTACLFGGQNRLFSADRDNIRIYNILDLNVVPIDFHALQKEIPFTNLMNHEFTFRHMIARSIGVSTKTMSIGKIHGYEPGRRPGGIDWDEYTEEEYISTMHPEDTLVRYLIFPTGFRRLHEYVNNTYRIMAGNTSLSLNKPKFLSDQLWNKVLVNNLYDNSYDNTFINFNKYNETRDLNEARRLNTIRTIDFEYNDNYVGIVPNRQRSVYFNDFIHNDNNKKNTIDINEVYTKGINTRNSVIFDINDINNINYIDNKETDIIHKLTYIKMNNNKPEYQEVLSANNDNNTKKLQYIGYEGYLRYQSKIVRWHEWFVQLQRVLRLLMRQQLEWIKDPVVHGHDSISEEVTEYSNNNTFTIEDYE